MEMVVRALFSWKIVLGREYSSWKVFILSEKSHNTFEVIFGKAKEWEKSHLITFFFICKPRLGYTNYNFLFHIIYYIHLYIVCACVCVLFFLCLFSAPLRSRIILKIFDLIINLRYRQGQIVSPSWFRYLHFKTQTPKQ